MRFGGFVDLRFKARVEVRTGRGLLDPESETVKKALVDLGFQVAQVRVSKVYEVYLEASTKKDAEITSRTLCSRLLVNPTKDDYSLEVEQVGDNSTSKP